MGGRGGARGGGGGGGGGGKRPEQSPRTAREQQLRDRGDRMKDQLGNVHARLRDTTPDTMPYRDLLRQRRELVKDYSKLSDALRTNTGVGLPALPAR